MIETKVPPLLDAELIRKVLQRVDENRTWRHGSRKHEYVLAHFVHCSNCGYTMNGSEAKYYRHSHQERKNACNPTTTHIPTSVLEDRVFRRLEEVFGDPRLMKRAVEEANPNATKTAECKDRLNDIAKAREGIKRRLDNLIAAVMDGTLTHDNVKSKRTQLEESDETLRIEADQLQSTLTNMPSPDRVQRIARKIGKRKLTVQDKRQLAELVFGGRRFDGKKLGVWITWTRTGWTFTLHGHLLDDDLKPSHQYSMEIGFKSVSLRRATVPSAPTPTPAAPRRFRR